MNKGKGRARVIAFLKAVVIFAMVVVISTILARSGINPLRPWRKDQSQRSRLNDASSTSSSSVSRPTIKDAGTEATPLKPLHLKDLLACDRRASVFREENPVQPTVQRVKIIYRRAKELQEGEEGYIQSLDSDPGTNGRVFVNPEAQVAAERDAAMPEYEDERNDLLSDFLQRATVHVRRAREGFLVDCDTEAEVFPLSKEERSLADYFIPVVGEFRSLPPSKKSHKPHVPPA